MTSAVNLAGLFADVTGSDSAWRATFVDGLDLLAWIWAVVGALAAARWLWSEAPAMTADAEPESIAPRHLLLSAIVILVLGLQVSAFFRARPTLWPFIDYPLYSRAHGTPVRTVHHRLYGLTAQEPVHFFEITADALGMSWFVYHTQLIPRMFDQPELVLDEFLGTLERSDLQSLRLLLPARTAFALVDSALVESSEHRPVPLIDVQEPSGAASAGVTSAR